MTPTADDEASPPPDLPAGSFSSWVAQMARAQREGADVDVPCGRCTACCTSSQFVHIGPDETGTLARIPRQLLFPAPGLPKGHVLMGHDQQGCCPMFVDGRCSIYDDRPRTCRTYDCRVFPAAAVELDDDAKALITERTQRWRFDFPTSRDRRQHDAVRAAATFLREHAADLGDGVVPRNATQLAFVAVAVHELFLAGGGEEPVLSPSIERVAAAVRQVR